MHNTVDTHLANYADRLQTMAVPEPRYGAHRPRQPRLSLAFIIVALIFVSIGSLAAARYLLPITSEEQSLARGLTAARHHAVKIERFVTVDRIDQLRDRTLADIARRMAAISQIGEIRESVSGSDVDFAAATRSGGRFYITLWKDEPNAKNDDEFSLADTNGAVASSVLWFSAEGVRGTISDLGGLRDSDRNALIKAAHGTGQAMRCARAISHSRILCEPITAGPRPSP